MKKDVYRKAALERLATVDQLDKVMKITSPLSWFALLGVTLIIVAVVIWAFTGSLPSTVTANGMIVSSTTATNTVFAKEEGTVEYQYDEEKKKYISEGDYITEDDVIAWITPVGGTVVDSEEQRVPCRANQEGFVADITKANGDRVKAEDTLIRIRPWPGYVDNDQKEIIKQVIVCYIPLSEIGKIKVWNPDEAEKMVATITLTRDVGNTYGHMEGAVINVDSSFSTPSADVSAIVGQGNSDFKVDGVCAVTLRPKLQSDSVNGYWWSTEKGKALELNDREPCSVKITTETNPPIFKLFTKLKEIWGGKK